jgi:hypothetical protein
MIELAAALMLGPITKFDTKKPDFEYVSNISVDAAERCLIDADGLAAPMVYKQADRPGAATVIYMTPNGVAGIRIDLVTKVDGLHVTAWEAPKRAMVCLPPIVIAAP